MAEELEPPDINRCQAETTNYNPWVMGGQVMTWERCKNTPCWVARESKPGPDGLKGAMSLCAECCGVFMDKSDATDYILEPIGEPPC